MLFDFLITFITIAIIVCITFLLELLLDQKASPHIRILRIEPSSLVKCEIVAEVLTGSNV